MSSCDILCTLYERASLALIDVTWVLYSFLSWSQIKNTLFLFKRAFYLKKPLQIKTFLCKKTCKKCIFCYYKYIFLFKNERKRKKYTHQYCIGSRTIPRRDGLFEEIFLRKNRCENDQKSHLSDIREHQGHKIKDTIACVFFFAEVIWI